MKIKSLYFENIRNHVKSELRLNDKLNVFYGANGAGKTTILEAISICGFSKSFLPGAETAAVREGASFYRARALSVSDLGIPYKIAVEYRPGTKKKISGTPGDNLIPKDIIGEIPTVILTPDFKPITFGPPTERRQFIDRALSQTGKIYIDLLYKYRRCLKQRNNLLARYKQDSYFDKALIAPWTEKLVEIGSEIAERRARFVSEFRDYFLAAYEKVSSGREKVDLIYEPFGDSSINARSLGRGDFSRLFENALTEKESDELRRGTSLHGPQKDELKIEIDGGTARERASQGQHKTLLISLKFAEFEFLREKKNETPIALFDDVFSELDRFRSAKVFEMIESIPAQFFITAADRDLASRSLPNSIEKTYFRVSGGKAIPE